MTVEVSGLQSGHETGTPDQHVRRYVMERLTAIGLDLSGKTVLTEAATGAYRYNAHIPMLAGAKHVIAFAKAGPFGSLYDVRQEFQSAQDVLRMGVSAKVVDDLDDIPLADVDIVTNSGHLRPFTEQFFSRLKTTAVLSLMWEPWELRSEEIDLAAAKDHGILVMGTNESHPKARMNEYPFLMVVQMLLLNARPIVNSRVLVIGDNHYLAPTVVKSAQRVGLNFRLIGTRCSRTEMVEHISWATDLIVAEHEYGGAIIGAPGSLIDEEMLAQNTLEFVGVISGKVDLSLLARRGLQFFPSYNAGARRMSVLPSILGPYPVIDLFCGGLAVGEAMSAARASGVRLETAALQAARETGGLAMPLDGTAATKP